MNFDDPNLRAIALRRIALLNDLINDLKHIVEGNGPTDEQLATAVVLRNCSMSSQLVPALAGIAYDHPTLGTREITTSQVFAIDPEKRWARTLSRFYRIGSADPSHAGPLQ